MPFYCLASKWDSQLTFLFSFLLWAANRLFWFFSIFLSRSSSVAVSFFVRGSSKRDSLSSPPNSALCECVRVWSGWVCGGVEWVSVWGVEWVSVWGVEWVSVWGVEWVRVWGVEWVSVWSGWVCGVWSGWVCGVWSRWVCGCNGGDECLKCKWDVRMCVWPGEQLGQSSSCWVCSHVHPPHPTLEHPAMPPPPLHHHQNHWTPPQLCVCMLCVYVYVWACANGWCVCVYLLDTWTVCVTHSHLCPQRHHFPPTAQPHLLIAQPMTGAHSQPHYLHHQQRNYRWVCGKDRL